MTSIPSLPMVAGYTSIDIIDEDPIVLKLRAVRGHDGTRVILKTPKATQPPPRVVARLMHEAQITQNLSIPGVVRLLAQERLADSLVLVFEDDPDGKSISLAHYLAQRGPLDIHTFLRIAVQLATALGDIHQHQLIHKDIKPQNVIIHPETGVIKITDFGIAMRYDGDSARIGAPDVLEGTFAYMSPEQTGRMGRSIDYRSDYYSLGITLYELLTGAPPFISDDPAELVHSHIARRPVPPHEINSGIPEVVSAIVMKLLAKAPEERYQHAHGIQADLEACLAQWQQQGYIDPFPLGRADRVATFRIPQVLYGRDGERQILHDVLTRVCDTLQGQTEVILLAGPLGIGKSALAQELQKATTIQRGHFVVGKGDSSQRAIPYLPVLQALSDLIRQILGERSDRVAALKEQLLEAIGSNGQVLIDVLPDLERFIGPQPPVPELGATESQHRFNLAIQRFVRVFADVKHPLVIFLDDVQWADPATITLVQVLISDPAIRHLLVVLAYRVGDEGSELALQPLYDQLQQVSGRVTLLELQPLAPAAVRQLVADTLHTEVAHIESLADRIIQKTGGNPFFIHQVLARAYEDHLLSFDGATNRWTWNEAAITQLAVDDIIALTTAKLQSLSDAAQDVLALAACIGQQFDLRLLTTIADQSWKRTVEALAQAMHEGIILALDEDVKLLHNTDDATLHALLSSDFNVSFRFIHERLQQAALSRLSESEVAQVHLRIGRQILAQVSADTLDDHIFTIVHHLNAASALLKDAPEGEQAITLNLAAARKAKAAAAYETAFTYLTQAISLLQTRVPNAWDTQFDLAYVLHKEQAECAALLGRTEEAEALFAALLQHARSAADKAQIYVIRTERAIHRGEYAQAVTIATEGLGLLGIVVPEAEEERQRAVYALMGEVQRQISASLDDILDAPEMEDQEKRAALDLLMAMIPAAYNVSPTLIALATLTMVNLSLTYGNAPVSAYGYIMYDLLSVQLGTYGTFIFRDLALRLIEQSGYTHIRPKALLIAGQFLDPWTFPLRTAIDLLRQCFQESSQYGDVPTAGFAAVAICGYLLASGEALDEVLRELSRYLTFAQQSRQAVVVDALTVMRQAIANLQGRTRDGGSLTTDGVWDETLFLQRPQVPSVLAVYHAFKLMTTVLQGSMAAAFEWAEQAATSSAALSGTAFLPDIAVAAALAYTAAGVDPATPEDAAGQSGFERYYQQIDRWAAAAPANWEPHRLLLAAERARLAGHHHEATDLYEQAIEAAQQRQLLHYVALANELAARFYLARGKDKFARIYLNDAYSAYTTWGAVGKAQALVETHPNLLSRSDRASGRPGSASETASSTATVASASLTSEERLDILDMMTVLKAAQAIAGEIVLDSLLTRLMQIVLENAGAQRAVLILRRDDQLIIEAVRTVDDTGALVRPGTPLTSTQDLPISVVQCVVDTLQPIVLDDAVDQTQFVDAYIRTNRPRSVMALPLIHQGQLTAVIYLENSLAPRIFTQDRLELVQLLSSQAAVAIENALLYQHLQEMSEQLRATNMELEEAKRSLELRVAERTAELQEAHERLQREYEERQRLQEEIIQAQQMTLAELSTPLVPITDNVLVMPLIGAMDSRRAQLVVETLLSGIQTTRGRVVIIDITGVPVVDTAVANTLVKAAQAAKLLGARTLITGIRPEVAQTLIGLGVDLTMETPGTLQNGIALALAQTDIRFQRTSTAPVNGSGNGIYSS